MHVLDLLTRVEFKLKSNISDILIVNDFLNIVMGTNTVRRQKRFSCLISVQGPRLTITSQKFKPSHKLEHLLQIIPKHFHRCDNWVETFMWMNKKFVFR